MSLSREVGGVTLLERGWQLLQISSHMLHLKGRGCAHMWAESKGAGSNALQSLWLHICDAELYAYFTKSCKGGEIENHLKRGCSAFKWTDQHIQRTAHAVRSFWWWLFPKNLVGSYWLAVVCSSFALPPFCSCFIRVQTGLSACLIVSFSSLIDYCQEPGNGCSNN